MTPEELETFRMKMDIQALQLVLRGLYSELASGSPVANEAYRAAFATLREAQAKVVLRDVNPAYSDMLASEYQDALSELLDFIEAGFPPAPR